MFNSTDADPRMTGSVTEANDMIWKKWWDQNSDMSYDLFS